MTVRTMTTQCDTVPLWQQMQRFVADTCHFWNVTDTVVDMAGVEANLWQVNHYVVSL
jgi:hypothetical protein